ncbi:CHASE2 domain-containing protein [Curvibacter sp. HBC61]|uniref:CHASE2 domain-containing protein n=1 Tax=Curvibacter cyanobacteriorum TaxID=3026422 RepID=A0ABT5N461_9BURK|nr:CHASE2 domain-containing protein [Curvibacter sp. HBC61]MDD0840872.1 CHASE2 domain-containing protein [Curvibacter sp. HBC61]
MNALFKVVADWFSTFLGAGVATLLRNNVLLAAVVFLFSNSGGWKYFASTIAAYDFRWAAHWSDTGDEPEQPLVIAIDDQGYRDYFGGHSPVSRAQMRALLRVIQAHTPASTRVAIDIDLSPGPVDGVAQRALDAFWLDQPGKWVLPAVQGGSPAQAQAWRQWREGLCQQGVQFGLPYVPTEFGAPRLTHQYEHSLGDALVRPGGPCVDPDAGAPTQRPMPLLAAALQRPAVLLFQGDLHALAQALDGRRPRAIVLGGFWGLEDRFDTPLGERFGVQLHAAAVAGAWRGERLGSRLSELLVHWTFLSLMSMLLFTLMQRLNAWTQGAPAGQPGLVFFDQVGKPVLLSLTVLACLFGWVTVNAWFHAWTGWWVSSVQACTSVPLITVIVWNYGRAAPQLYKGVRSAWTMGVSEPMRKDLHSLRSAWARLQAPAAAPPGAAADPAASQPLPRWRLWFELGASSLSLLMQNGVPVLTTGYLIYKMCQ